MPRYVLPRAAGAAAMDAGAGPQLAKSGSGHKGRSHGLRARGDGAQMPFEFPIPPR